MLANKQHKAPNETSYAQLLGNRPAHRLAALVIHVALQLAVESEEYQCHLKNHDQNA